jgi:hypothetical protein
MMSGILAQATRNMDIKIPTEFSTEVSTGAGAAIGAMLIVYIAIGVLMVIGMWKMFTKAGRPGWGAIIPGYNLYLLVDIAGKPWWYFLIIVLAGFIPFVGWIASLVFTILVMIDLAKSFGKGTGFTVGLILLQPIFILILGFGSAKYLGNTPAAPACAGGDGVPPVQ